MPAKGAPTRIRPVRLQTVDNLRIRRPHQSEKNKCLTIMSSVLNCWASSGHTIQGCMAIEQQLRDCMDNAKPRQTKRSTINYHLMRMFPKMSGPRKK